jgi:hypothetical protein
MNEKEIVSIIRDIEHCVDYNNGEYVACEDYAIKLAKILIYSGKYNFSVKVSGGMYYFKIERI